MQGVTLAMIALVFLVSSLAVASGAGEGDAVKPELPRVLIIGDSISVGYTEPVKALLEEEASVSRIPENGSSTGYGIKKLTEWLGDTKWDVIHFNWGLHDLKYLKAGKLDISGERVSTNEEYEANLTELVKRLKATGAKLIWASTTPVPEGADGRVAGSEVDFNEIARKIMEKNGVLIDDLHAAVLPHLDKYQQPHNVHFRPEGSQFLAEKVAEKIHKAIEQ